MKTLYKRILSLVMAGTLLFACGCGKTPVVEEAEPATTISNLSKPKEDISSETLAEASLEEKEAFATSSPENDTDIGLKSIKIDNAEAELTQEQKMIIQYFDDDYLEVEEYEFLSRYANVFTGVQVRVFGKVAKIIALNDETYQFVCTDYEDGYSMLVTCSTSGPRYIEGDSLSIYGFYEGEQMVEVDGKSYILPSIKANDKTYIYQMGVVSENNLHSLERIKVLAETIFGKNIEIRKPVIGDEGFAEGYNEEALNWYYVVELENQSNAKFSKYLFHREAGYIKDMRSSENIQRSIEFSADFEHFFLFTYDTSLETLTLEYYDSSLNKIWKREFAETTNAEYDYTKNNVYLIANNELFIINIETGEDTFNPVYVGERADIRKLNDGILLLAENKSDALMKIDVHGNMVWKTNLSADMCSWSIQVVGDKIILGAYLDDEYWLPHYIVVDNSTGEILIDAVSMSEDTYYE